MSTLTKTHYYAPRSPLECYEFEEVGCFIAAQALAAGFVGNDNGAALLPALTSLYKGLGLYGQFRAGRGYPEFANTVLSEQCGLEIRPTLVQRPADLIQVINTFVHHYGSVVVPCDAATLPYSAYHGGSGQRHYMVVTTDAKGRFGVYDNLHHDPEGLRKKYSFHAMSPDDIVDSATSFWQTFLLGSPCDDPGLFVAGPRYFVYTVAKTKAISTPQALGCLMTSLGAAVAAYSRAPGPRWVDRSALVYAVERLKASPASFAAEGFFKSYLASVKFADAYLAYVEYLLGQVVGSDPCPYILELRALSSDDQLARTRPIVQMLSIASPCEGGVFAALARLEKNHSARVRVYSQLLEFAGRAPILRTQV